ncbi:MAG TPA: DMT family transporter [Thermoanaerobaculia bacterium]|nr:DMT family transporter [Thermoanaerobaculia bacterium]
MKRRLATLALLATAAAWGATFTMVKNVIAKMAPEAFIFWRFLVAAVVLLGVVFLRRRWRRGSAMNGTNGTYGTYESHSSHRSHESHASLLPGVILGLLIFGAYWTQTRGLMTISPSRSAFLTGLYVVLVPFLQGKVKRNAWIAAGLALLGTIVLVGKPQGSAAIGDALTIACALFSAFHVVYAARFTTQDTATGLAAIQVAFVALAAAPFAAFSPPVAWSASIVSVILFTAIVTTALAFAALMWGQAHVSATEAAVILSFEPVAAAITSIAFYGEPMTAAFLIGAALILAAMLLSQL